MSNTFTTQAYIPSHGWTTIDSSGVFANNTYLTTSSDYWTTAATTWTTNDWNSTTITWNTYEPVTYYYRMPEPEPLEIYIPPKPKRPKARKAEDTLANWR